MRNLYIIIILFCVKISVKSHQYEANQVYLQLSNKIDNEIVLLQQKHERQLQNIKVEILSKVESQMNEKIESVRTEILSSQPVHSEASRNTIHDSEAKADDTETKLEEIKDGVAIIKQAFNAEKRHVRTLQERTYSCAERLKAINDTMLRNEEVDKENKESLERRLRNLRATQRRLGESQVRNEEADKQNKDSLERQLRNLGATQRRLGIGQDTLEQEVEKLIDKQSSLNTTVGNNRDLFTQLVNKMERGKVAFSASIVSRTVPLPIGSTVVFDDVLFQEGNGYNPKDGVFTCPETGVYMFSVVIDNGRTGEVVAVQLLVDSAWKGYIVSEERNEHKEDQASNLVIFKVNKGQKVWVEIFYYTDVVIREHFSTFSGVLLYN